jgi:hypothetical protein
MSRTKKIIDCLREKNQFHEPRYPFHNKDNKDDREITGTNFNNKASVKRRKLSKLSRAARFIKRMVGLKK